MRKMPPLRIAARWLSYSEAVMPRDVSEVQRQETRRAFYAGAAALFAIITSDPLMVDDDDEKSGVRLIEELAREMEHFVSRIGKGV